MLSEIMIKYFKVQISATSKDEAKSILRMLVEKKMVAGGKYQLANSIHWREGKIDEEEYYVISAFMLDSKKDQIIKEVTKVHSDQVPVIHYYHIDHGNQSFLDWIEKNVE